MKKSKDSLGGMVYSTNPSFEWEKIEPEIQTPDPKYQDLRIELNRKLKAGKIATMISGFIGKEEDFQELAKKLKSFCGAGGSAKDGIILVQGDFKEKVFNYLLKEGYKVKKSGG